jgi:hypothetical protein
MLEMFYNIASVTDQNEPNQVSIPGSNITCFTIYIHLWPVYWLSRSVGIEVSAPSLIMVAWIEKLRKCARFYLLQANAANKQVPSTVL